MGNIESAVVYSPTSEVGSWESSYNQYSFLALPLSTSQKTNKYKISSGLVNGKQAIVNLSQMRNIDSNRLAKKVGHIDAELFLEIKKKASHILWLAFFIYPTPFREWGEPEGHLYST